MAAGAASKKRPRAADLLSSLDAAFAPATQPSASKYTSQAAAQAAPKAANSQQAYLHSKRKKRRNGGGKGRDKEKGESKQERGNNARSKGRADASTSATDSASGEPSKSKAKAVEPLYEKLSVDVLAVGLKDCSLRSKVPMLSRPREQYATFRQYMTESTKGTAVSSTAVDRLKNKVLSLDNPIKPTKAAASVNGSMAQTAKLLGARRRRQLGLHLLHGDMRYSDAEQLSAIWMRYVRETTRTELAEDTSGIQTQDAQRARNAKLQARLKGMDLSGCPLEVVQSRNPCNVGLRGIVVAETQQVLQLCCPTATPLGGTIRTLAKGSCRFRMRVDGMRSVLLDGDWLATRAQ